MKVKNDEEMKEAFELFAAHVFKAIKKRIVKIAKSQKIVLKNESKVERIFSIVMKKVRESNRSKMINI